VLLNLLLLPLLGLAGAVLATTVANALCLALAFWLCRLAGMRVDGGTLVAALATVAIAGGFEWACIALGMLLLLAMRENWFLNGDEIAQIDRCLRQGWERIRQIRIATPNACKERTM
jgi:hypothetical protein